MGGHRSHAIAALTALLAWALIAAGCGGDDETTTTTSTGESAEQSVDAAINSCNDEAQQLSGLREPLWGAHALPLATRPSRSLTRAARTWIRRSRSSGLLQERGRPAPLGPGSGCPLQAVRRDCDSGDPAARRLEDRWGPALPPGSDGVFGARSGEVNGRRARTIPIGVGDDDSLPTCGRPAPTATGVGAENGGPGPGRSAPAACQLAGLFSAAS